MAIREASFPVDYHNFAPRIGFAYDLTGNGTTKISGGYGIFYFVDRGGISNQLAQNPPFSGQDKLQLPQRIPHHLYRPGAAGNTDLERSCLTSCKLRWRPHPAAVQGTDPGQPE